MTSDALKRAHARGACSASSWPWQRISRCWWLVEDVHWVDPTTRELIDLMLWSAFATCRSSSLITFRPEFVPAWAGHAARDGADAQPPGAPAMHRLVDSLCGGKALPAEVLDQIIARTDGVPLFVEELTKTVLESGSWSNATAATP